MRRDYGSTDLSLFIGRFLFGVFRVAFRLHLLVDVIVVKRVGILGKRVLVLSFRLLHAAQHRRARLKNEDS